MHSHRHVLQRAITLQHRCVLQPVIRSLYGICLCWLAFEKKTINKTKTKTNLTLSRFIRTCRMTARPYPWHGARAQKRHRFGTACSVAPHKPFAMKYMASRWRTLTTYTSRCARQSPSRTIGTEAKCTAAAPGKTCSAKPSLNRLVATVATLAWLFISTCSAAHSKKVQRQKAHNSKTAEPPEPPTTVKFARVTTTTTNIFLVDLSLVSLRPTTCLLVNVQLTFF